MFPRRNVLYLCAELHCRALGGMSHTSLKHGKEAALGTPNKLVAVQDIVVEAL